MKNLQRRSAPLAILAALATVPAVAFAFEAIDTIPWPSVGGFPAYPREADRPVDVWLHVGALRDDNALRTETDPQSDTIGRFGGGVRYEQRVVGRQRLRLEARGDYYKYHELSELDHFAYALAGDWLWEIGNNLAGTVSAGHLQRQVDLSETQVERLDLVKTWRLAASAGYLVTPRFRLRGGLAGEHSERDEARQTETRSASMIIGADYVSPLANTIGLEYRTTNGEAPNEEDVAGVTVNNDYREQEFSLVSTYALGTQLRLSLRLGHTIRDYDQVPFRNFDGNTGRVAVDWLPGNKTILTLEAYQEPRSVIDVAASHMLIKGVAFGPRWAATNQVVLSARLLRERQVFEGDPALAAGGTLRDELVSLIRFGIGWEPARRWQISLADDRGERESNVAGRDYDFTSLMGNLAWVW